MADLGIHIVESIDDLICIIPGTQVITAPSGEFVTVIINPRPSPTSSTPFPLCSETGMDLTNPSLTSLCLNRMFSDYKVVTVTHRFGSIHIIAMSKKGATTTSNIIKGLLPPVLLGPDPVLLAIHDPTIEYLLTFDQQNIVSLASLDAADPTLTTPKRRGWLKHKFVWLLFSTILSWTAYHLVCYTVGRYTGNTGDGVEVLLSPWT